LRMRRVRPALMLTPSGATPIVITSAPSPEAPWARPVAAPWRNRPRS
jgi:hypothetical protein